MEGYDFSQVSPTALIPVVSRGEYTDIPFAKEMLAYLKKSAAIPSYSSEEVRSYAPFFEARFKAVSNILMEQRSGQVLELASGFSPRGMDLCRRGILYVELDLDGMIDQKRRMVAAILGTIPDSLKLVSGSVLDQAAVTAACASFRDEPVTITTEGLLRYLTFEEKTQFASNVKQILARYGGTWVTPDIHIKEFAPGRSRSEFHQQLMQGLGRDIGGNYFDSVEHARVFFEACGFSVEDRPLLENIRNRVGCLSFATPSLLAQLEQRRIFVLSL